MLRLSFKHLNAVPLLALVALEARAASPPTPPEIAIRRATGRISIDGDLSDDGWRSAYRVETWYETNPGDNTPPEVGNVGYLAYDDKALYAGFEFQDPEPRTIRAPLGDRDNVPGTTDYGGVILDTRNDGKTGILFLANPRGIQYDAVSSDASGNEDSSPDFFWEAAARITDAGWVLEIRIPFSSLRYPRADPTTWGIMLYRNYPRAYRYQFFSTTLPRGGNCFICRSNKLVGLSDLPSGGHFVAAPYVSGSRTAEPRGGALGSDLESGPVEAEIGLDLKWTPGASTAVDATVNPDFSQIESDVAQITSNERFALFFPEKRPFFLEGVDLLSTPVPAVYTRTITAPRWGTRATGKLGATAYTVLVAQDEGGGSVILPGSNSSALADQDFRSWVAIGRARRDVGRSFVSVLATDREIEGGGYNRVFGPDFQWRPTADDNLTGQLLFGRSRTPHRPDLAPEWDGRSLAGHAADVWWHHSTRRVDWFVEYKDFGDEFRADDGFVPQVGYRQSYAEAGYTLRPRGFLRRLRTGIVFNRSAERDGDLLSRQYALVASMNGRWNSFFQIHHSWERVRAADTVLPRRRLRYTIEASPSRLVNQVFVQGHLGDEVDFTGARVGRGLSLFLQATLRPTDHLELRANVDRRRLDLPTAAGPRTRLFTARVDRLRATYTFTSRMFVRLIGQFVETRRDPSLYRGAVAPRDAALTASALFAYKLNWQTVLFVGYGDNRALAETDTLEPSSRQLFAKVSYALQR